MAGIKGIIGAFFPFGEAAYALVLTEGVKLSTAAGDKLMGIDLMAYVPDQFISWSVEDVMQGKGEFNNPQAGSQMATGMGNCLNDFCPDFFSKEGEFAYGEFAKIVRGINLF
jgi:hypothetical protein